MANKFQVCKHCEDVDCLHNEEPCVGCFWHNDMPFPLHYCEQNTDSINQETAEIPQKIAVNDCTGGREIRTHKLDINTSLILQNNFSDYILFTGFKDIEYCKEIIESGYCLVAVFKRVNRK